MTNNEVKQLHIKLDTPEQIADYETVRDSLGIQRDNDLVRYLLRKEARAIHADAVWQQRLAIIRAGLRGELSEVETDAALALLDAPAENAVQGVLG